MVAPGVRLDLGVVVATPGALKALDRAGQTPEELLARHAEGDWGEIGAADWIENDRSLHGGCRILSVYTLATGVAIWVITEGDRSATTILLPDEY